MLLSQLNPNLTLVLDQFRGLDQWLDASNNIMIKYFQLFLFLFAVLLPLRVWGADSANFTCTALIFDAKDFNTASNNDMVDIGKLSGIAHNITYITTFSFNKIGTAKCMYKAEDSSSHVVEKENFVYPDNGDNHTIKQMTEKLNSFLGPLRFAGLLQYEELMSNQSLASVLSNYTRLPTPPGDRYLQFKQEIPFNTIIVVSDLAEEKIMYRIVVPNTNTDYKKVIGDFKARLKASGKTDDEIALLMPNFMKVISALKAQVQMLKEQPQFAQFETYTYEN
jgi:hypothetical protein